MLRKRIAIWMSVLMIFGLIGGGAAHAENATVTADVLTAGGMRFITPFATPVGLDPLGGSYKGDLVVAVQELAIGGAKWKVTAQLAGPFKSGANEIAASNLSMASATVTMVAGGGDILNKGSGSLDAQRTIYENHQDTTLAYTGEYISISPLTLTVPNGSKIGLYTSTVTVTLSTFL